MANCVIDCELIRRMLDNGFRNLYVNIDTVDNLNVFPVPDGDTGTNMAMTVEGGVHAADSNKASNVGELMKDVSRGTLFSARGNSGVIVSQYIRGMAEAVVGKETMTVTDFAEAMAAGTTRAYSAVIHPVEGTILTVMRAASDFAVKHAAEFQSIDELLNAVIPVMKTSLDHTPELLPVLKEAGVIDSGGAGLLYIFTGMKMAVEGKMIDVTTDKGDAKLAVSAGTFGSDSELEFGYCTEFILQLQNAKTNIKAFDLNKMIKDLEALGDSIVAVMDDSVVKVHIHSFTPEKVLGYARNFGEFVTLKIENMSVQHNEIEGQKAAKKEHLKYAIVAVADGDGIESYFREIGVTEVVNGGQTNNPSTDDFIKVFEGLDAEHIVVLPNNSNIVMTASQAAELYDKADIRVIKTKSIAEGYSALSMMDLSADTVEELIEGMTEYLPGVTTCSVTTATRDTVMNGVEVKMGKYIGLDGDSILCCEDTALEALIAMLKNLPDIDEKQVITMFYGSDVSDEELQKAQSLISEAYPLIDFGCVYGGQNVYNYILSVE